MLMMAILPDGISAGESIKNIDLPPDVKSLFESSIDSSQIPDKAAFWKAVTRGFVVSENALGDMNQDGFINIWDLLRIRNIYIGIGDPASSYESVEGDMNQDMVIDAQDVYIYRDALIQLAGIPHLIGPEGGTVIGQDIILGIPSNPETSTSIISTRKISGGEIYEKFGIDVIAETVNNNYYFAGFEIEADSNFDLSKSFRIDIIPDSTPPCQFNGDNLLLEIIDDLDGGGKSNLILSGYMTLSDDSSSLIVDSLNTLSIDSILTYESSITQVSKTTYKSSVPISPGSIIEIYGSNMPAVLSSIVIKYVSAQGYSGYFPALDLIYDSTSENETIIGVKSMLPYLGDPGITDLYVYDITNNRLSTHLQVEIDTPALGPSNPADTLVVIRALVDSLFNRFEQCSIFQSVFSPLSELIQQELPTIRNYIIGYLDTLSQLSDTNLMGQAVGIYINAGLLNDTRSLLQILDSSFCSSDTGLLYYGISRFDFYETGIGLELSGEIVNGYIAAAIVGAGLVFVITPNPATLAGLAWALESGLAAKIIGEGLQGIGHGLQTLPEGWGEFLEGIIPGWENPRGFYGGLKGNSPTGGIGSNGKRQANGCCINITNYRQNVCGNAKCPISSSRNIKKVEYYIDGDPFYIIENTIGGINRSERDSVLINLSTWESPLDGAIIAPTNVSAAYGIVGYIDKAGNWLIPSLPMNTDVTLSIYDPKTGHYDPEAATFHTNNIPGDFGLVLAIYSPDTTTCYYAAFIGDEFVDSVSSDCPRIEYTLYNSVENIGRQINLGFQAENDLTFWFQDPDLNYVIKDSLADCAFEFQYELDKTGDYLITVTYGATGGEGLFNLGLSEGQEPPTPYFCGEIPYDTLYEIYSPYKFGSYSYLSSGDTLIIEPGVDLQFKEGGRIQSFGSARGLTTPTNPIILTPTAWDSVKTGGYYSFGVDGVNLRKEVNR